MKNLIVGLMLLTGAQAFAEEKIYCHTPNVADAGYSLVIDVESKAAELSEDSFVGSQLLAHLTCFESQSQRHYPDALNTVLTCYQMGIFDGGYYVEYQVGGFAGLRQAILSEQSIMGPRPLDTLRCSNF